MVKMLFLIVVLTYIICETEAIIEYFRLLRLKFTKYREFDKQKEMMPSLTYFNFLLMKYPNFGVKLVSCPICLMVWANLALILFNLDIWMFFGLNVFFCWVMFYLFKLLIIKNNE